MSSFLPLSFFIFPFLPIFVIHAFENDVFLGLYGLVFFIFIILPFFIRDDRVALLVPLLLIEFVFGGWLPITELRLVIGSRKVFLLCIGHFATISIIRETYSHGRGKTPVAFFPCTNQESRS